VDGGGWRELNINLAKKKNQTKHPHTDTDKADQRLIRTVVPTV